MFLGSSHHQLSMHLQSRNTKTEAPVLNDFFLAGLCSRQWGQGLEERDFHSSTYFYLFIWSSSSFLKNIFLHLLKTAFPISMKYTFDLKELVKVSISWVWYHTIILQDIVTGRSRSPLCIISYPCMWISQSSQKKNSVKKIKLEGNLKKRGYMYIQPIHSAVQQKLTQHCEAIILQQKLSKKLSQ